jgi:hypothetical protein
MNWQLLVGTGVFVGTIVMLLYVRHRSPRLPRLPRRSRAVLRTLTVDVAGTPAAAIRDVGTRTSTELAQLVAIMRDLEERGLLEMRVGDDGAFCHVTPVGLLVAQRGVRRQHGRHR